MKDGFTKDLKASHGPASFEDFHGKFSIKLVVIAGASAGTEYAMESARVTLGRGPGVDIEFADDAMSRQHAVIEYAAGALNVRDLGSTNRIAVNGAEVQAAQLVVENRDAEPETYVISGTV